MSRLVLGIVDVAYTDAEHPGATTTYKVARKLEDEYGVMKTFFVLHENEIGRALTDAYITSLKNPRMALTRGIPLPKVNSLFRDYLSSDEWQRSTGEVIQAALKGRSSRKKARKYATARPAFVDTGLYRRSFRAWLQP